MIANRLGDRHLFLAQLAPSWTNWHWGPDCKIIRRSENNPERIEECNDKEHLEGALKSLFEIRQQYLEIAQKSKPSRAKELNNGVRDKDKQTAWVEEKLEALRRRSPREAISSCPACQETLLRLSDGCGICGWLPEKLLGDKNKSPGKDVKQSNISPSNNSPSKTRRRKGEGNGSIHWRTITRNDKDYFQAYYHWKEKGKKRTKYIRSHLLERVIEAEEQKRPVIEILQLLGVVQSLSNEVVLGDNDKSPSKDAKQSNISSSKNSPSKRRDKGEGSGCIYWRTITKNGKDYQQAYYHYEFWSDGDRIIKSSKYIPKRLLDRVQKLDDQKAPIVRILELLGVKL
jgi:hypothetical protein